MSTSQRAGVIAASASVPRSLVPLLQPRTSADQGLITGLTAATNYSLTTIAHEVSRATARGLLKSSGASTDPASTTRMTMAVNLTGLGFSSALYASLPYRTGESIRRGFTRAVTRRIMAASAAGLIAASLDKLPARVRPIASVLRSAPVLVALGAGTAGTVQHLRSKSLRIEEGVPERPDMPPLVRSIGIGALAAAGAIGLAALERATARGIGAGISRATRHPGGGAVTGHLISLGVIGAVVYGMGFRYFRQAEREMSEPDAVLSDSPKSPRVSGGTGSLVSWDPLTREVRRHLATATPKERIASVMGKLAQSPIRVYIGLHSAPTEGERVQLALEEIERTGALDRSLLVLCSPTGSGFVNYAASAAWEYLSRGDCASVTLQYSSRPSWLSLDRVDEGREQNRAMWTALAKVIAKREPEKRPRVVVFGESLGAHTSQDPFLGSGTRGFKELGIERALWFGIPQTSRWALEVQDPRNTDVEPGEVIRVTNVDTLDHIDRDASPARYVMVAHEDDAVTLFSPSLLVEHPWWLGNKRPAAIPKEASWSSPTTFLQVAVDAKNAGGAMKPGVFSSIGHDYRGDVVRAVRFAFDLPATKAQTDAVEKALEKEELEYVALWGED